MCDQKCMTIKNAKRFRMQAGMIIDDLTGKHYTTLQQCCKLLNQVSDRADRNAELYYAIPKGIRDVWCGHDPKGKESYMFETDCPYFRWWDDEI